MKETKVLPSGWWTQLKDHVDVGVIQTNINAKQAWGAAPKPFAMSNTYAAWSWLQIRQAFRAFSDGGEKPNIILIPELSVPRSRVDDLRRLACRANALVLAGSDYIVNIPLKKIRNVALVVVPHAWAKGETKPAAQSSLHLVGKTYAAPKEMAAFKSHGLSFVAEPNVFIFQTLEFGRFGVCICYDLLDLERALLYRGQVTHLFVLAYNQDITSFYQLAESSSRSVYCNVVICNTGYFGGSLATCTRYRPHERTIYRHEGGDLFALQVVRLPVKRLVEAQAGQIKHPATGDQEFKNLPPGFTTTHIIGALQKSLIK